MRKLAAAIALSLPLTAFAQGFYGDTAPQYNVTSTSGMNFASFVASIIGVINTLIPMFITIGMAIFFVGLFEYVYHSDSASGRTKGVEFIKWGLVSMFVLVSLWGILDVAKSSIFGSSTSTTSTTATTASQNTVVGP